MTNASVAQVTAEDQKEIEAEYQAIYERYGPQIVGFVTGPGARGFTVRLGPQPAREP